jgi:SNF2 family DNA or RNA helicase
MFDLSSGFVRRVILTGTPIANRPYDIWSLIYFLDHGQSLGRDFQAFRRSTDLSNKLGSDENRRDNFEESVGGVWDRLKKFCIRETKLTAGIELPSKTFETVFVTAEDGQREIYENYRDELRTVVVKGGVPQLDQAEYILKRLLRLVQIASNPRLVDESYASVPAKLDVLTALLTDRMGDDASSKAIVWTSFTENADWLARQLREYNAIRLHGKLSIDDRNRAVAKFKTDETVRVLVATPGAAKEGLTLTVANHAVFYDRSFSLDDYLQAQDRIHRISQDRPCVIYNLIMRDTVDEWVDSLLAAKYLAAQLGVGDIDRAEYTARAEYDFAATLDRILSPRAERLSK